jgi:hypothetical protein
VLDDDIAVSPLNQRKDGPGGGLFFCNKQEQLPCRNLNAHSIKRENDVAIGLECAPNGELSGDLPLHTIMCCEQFGSSSR